MEIKIFLKNRTCILFLPAGATQVRWNRLSRYLLATAHDGDIKLWDQRKGTAPIQYIAAHLAKVSTHFGVFMFVACWKYCLLCFLKVLAHDDKTLWNPSRLSDLLICGLVTQMS
jgi:hypothetical protein